MDLFNRKALADTRGRLSNLERALAHEIAMHAITREAADLRAVKWNDAVIEKHELEVKNAVLTERLDLLTSGVLDQAPSPASWGEDVEDAEYLFRTGRLDKSEFEAALEQAGFSNTEITFDSGSLPRI